MNMTPVVCRGCIKEVVFVFCLNCILKLNNNKKAQKLVGLLFLFGWFSAFKISSHTVCVFCLCMKPLVICLSGGSCCFMYFMFFSSVCSH